MSEATLTVSPRFVTGSLDRRLFGGFLEQGGRAIYSGVYEPGHQHADASGFRQDVLDLVRELGVTTIRYPGGNFVSGYRWEDGTGPQALRPTRPELAWHSTEPNTFGLDEFARWVPLTGAEPMLAVNLGTRGIEAAIDLLEYCNMPGGTAQADRRRQNGLLEPIGVKMWCLGNEMDGPWQIGYTDATSYGRLANQAGRAMKALDPSIQLTLCGSSTSDMATFGHWERAALEESYDTVDFISAHQYYCERDGDLQSYLNASTHFERYLDDVIATIDHVKAARKSTKTVDLSVDEWGIWYTDDHLQDVAPDEWPTGARILEDLYNYADAVVLGSMIISLLKRADRVRAASLAQIINVIAPIMTEPGGTAWAQTTFVPFSQAARGAGDVVLTTIVDAPRVDSERFEQASTIDAASTFDDTRGVLRIFAVNRHSSESTKVTIDLPGWDAVASAHVELLHSPDPRARATASERPRPTRHQVPLDEGVHFALPPVSWAVFTIQLTGTSSSP
ncbi:alpha-L-arabinofuranosidase [Curtobacterium sp. VKM Ac-1376]|nr:alpha-L-arabinofuranosidase [Curtobacterium sp. VKM Ac-1376]